jgi:hypothetical protein
LTIKFTRHTAASLPALSFWLLAVSLATTRLENFMSLKLPAHHAFDALTSRAPAGVSLSRHS